MDRKDRRQRESQEKREMGGEKRREMQTVRDTEAAGQAARHETPTGKRRRRTEADQGDGEREVNKSDSQSHPGGGFRHGEGGETQG